MTHESSTALAPRAPRPATGSRADVWIPAGLIALAAVPTFPGVVRLLGLAMGESPTPENARFVADPIPAIVHIVGATAFCVVGAFQFSPGLRRRRLGWHRAAGRALAPLGLVGALAGMWMTVTYPPVEHAGPVLYAMRLTVAAAMAGFILLGLAALGRRDFSAHGAWMTRAYAIALAGGTQALTHLPYFLFDELRSEASRAVAMGAGWAINAAVAEWALRRRRGRTPGPQDAPAQGARVTAVCGPGSVELVRSLGADRVLDYTKREHERDEERYDAVFRVNGYRSLADHRARLAPGGTCVMVGGTTRQLLEAVGATQEDGPVEAGGRREELALPEPSPVVGAEDRRPDEHGLALGPGRRERWRQRVSALLR